MKAIIDGDGIVYACGFMFDKATEERGGEEEPLHVLYGAVKGMVHSLTDAAWCDEYELYISGSTNFRIDMYPEYKANRASAPQPTKKAEIRAYMRVSLGAILTDGIEADDACGIAVWKNMANTVLVSVDKDLNMIPGYHYNYHAKHKSKGVYYISPLDAIRTFYKQVLKGDATDNVPGVFRVTGKKATKAMLAPIDSMISPLGMFEYCVEQYNGDKALVMALCKLLWIQRIPEDRFTVPTH